MKASVIVLVALAATTLMRKRSAAVRHWVLFAAIVCAAAAPGLELLVPSWHLSFGRSAPSPRTETPAQEAAAAAPAPSAPAVAVTRPRERDDNVRSSEATAVSVTGALTALWLTGIGVSLAVLVTGLGRLAWLASRSQRITSGAWTAIAADISRRYGLTRKVRLLQSDHPTLVVTWGLLQPKVILPRTACDWPEDRIRIVLAHELAHIQRGDWLMQMTAEMFRSIYWFNPLVRIAGRRLRQESEIACDDVVLNLGVQSTEYAGHLLDLARDAVRSRARWTPSLPAPAIVRPSSLERRIAAMLNTRLDRAPLSRSARTIAVIALSLVTISVAGFGQAFVTFSGSIVDPNGRIVPGVTARLSNAQEKREVRSDAAGRFEFTGVPAGEYVFETEFMGFKSTRANVTLAGRSIQRNVAMEIGSLQETITVVGGPPASTAQRPASPRAPFVRPQPEYDPCGASPVGGCIKPPTKLRDVKPEYPQALSDAKVGGVVRLVARIGTEGSIVNVQLADPADPIDPALVQAAIAAVRQWEFTPTQLGGVPIETDMKVTANFVAER
jgi:TonB family protein